MSLTDLSQAWIIHLSHWDYLCVPLESFYIHLQILLTPAVLSIFYSLPSLNLRGYNAYHDHHERTNEGTLMLNAPIRVYNYNDCQDQHKRTNKLILMLYALIRVYNDYPDQHERTYELILMHNALINN